MIVNNDSIVLSKISPTKLVDLGDRLANDLEEVLKFYQSDEFEILTIEDKAIVQMQLQALNIYIEAVTTKVQNLIVSGAIDDV